MKKRVVCISGDWNSNDFVLEPACDEDCNCEYCKDAFWIEEVENGRNC